MRPTVSALNGRMDTFERELKVVGGRLDKLDLNGHKDALISVAIAAPALVKLAAAAPVLIAAVTKAQEDAVFWAGLKKRMPWTTGWPARMVAITGFTSAVAWATIGIINLLHQMRVIK